MGLVARLIERLKQLWDALLALHMLLLTLSERRLLLGKLVAPFLIRCVVDLSAVLVKPILPIVQLLQQSFPLFLTCVLLVILVSEPVAQCVYLAFIRVLGIISHLLIFVAFVEDSNSFPCSFQHIIV